VAIRANAIVHLTARQYASQGEGIAMSSPSLSAIAPKETLAPATKSAKILAFDNRYLAPLLITCILIVGDLSYGFIESHSSPLMSRLTFGLINSYSPTFVAILASIGLELIIGRVMIGRLPHLASAYITGISVGILIRSPELSPYILCSGLAIASKYAIRIRGRHLWNPSNLGVSMMLFLAPLSVASLSLQWGNEIWPVIIIWSLGLVILYRLGRLHISLSYALAFVVLAKIRSWITGDSWLTEAAPITGPMYQLFIFFMLTDPKTTTRARWSQRTVAIAIAIVESVFRLRQVVQAPYYALFLVGPFANVIEIGWDIWKGAAVSKNHR
jgi:Na+-transporting NADH:ubiquinone oxidoreductase subunit NqrB